MNHQWKNPYQVKRKEREIREVKSEISTSAPSANAAKPISNQDFLTLINNFRDGVKGISSSIQQFEKTMESLSTLYQTFEKLGGVKQVNQFLSPANRVGTAKSAGNPIQHFSTLMNLLEKVDFKQINQFLSSPMIQGIFPAEESQKRKREIEH